MIYQIFILQFLLSSVISTLLFFIYPWQTSLSFCLGSLINILPSLLLGKIFFKNRAAGVAKKIVKSLYWGEFVKILITLFLFVGIFQWSELQALALFLGFILAQMAYWIILFKEKNL